MSRKNENFAWVLVIATLLKAGVFISVPVICKFFWDANPVEVMVCWGLFLLWWK